MEESRCGSSVGLQEITSMEVAVHRGMISGVNDIIEVLTERVRLLEKELHSRQVESHGGNMEIRTEALSLLKAISPFAVHEWYEENAQVVEEWLLRHDAKILFRDDDDE